MVATRGDPRAVFVEGFQTGMGYAGALVVHIPLGLTIVGVTVAMFIWSLVWRPVPHR